RQLRSLAFGFAQTLDSASSSAESPAVPPISGLSRFWQQLLSNLVCGLNEKYQQRKRHMEQRNEPFIVACLAGFVMTVIIFIVTCGTNCYIALMFGVLAAFLLGGVHRIWETQQCEANDWAIDRLVEQINKEYPALIKSWGGVVVPRDA
ncbi:MAG: hypothetical protein SNJ82_01275, partial [Gemmataceae bacterium]